MCIVYMYAGDSLDFNAYARCLYSIFGQTVLKEILKKI